MTTREKRIAKILTENPELKEFMKLALLLTPEQLKLAKELLVAERGAGADAGKEV